MELRDYLNVLRARRGIIITAVVIVLAVSMVVSLLQPGVYEAEAKILVSEKDPSAALFGAILPELSSQPERALETQVQLVQLRPVAEQTIKELSLEEEPDELLNRVTVATIGQTNLISIKVQAETPEEAADVANAMAGAYVDASRERKRSALREASEEVERRLEVARQEILELGKTLRDAGKSDDLAAELQIASDTYATLAEKLEQLRINEQLEEGSGSLVQAAVVQVDQVSPNPTRNALVGLVVGLVFGVGMAFLYEYLDNTIKSTAEAERIYGAPVLGIVPLEKFEKGVRRKLAIVDTPGSAAAESYRVLRNSLDFINFEHDLKTLLVTSAIPAEGKSTVSANLAMSLAQTGKKVVLVSCDFRRPTTDQFFGVNNMIGLSDVLLGTHALKSALQRPLDEQLLVLTAGKMPPNPSELLGSTKMQEIIESLEEWADWVIVDTPPVLAVADPVSVARWVDGVLVVSKAGESTREAAEKSVELLGKVGARVIGVAVWGLDETKNRPGYGYGYYTGGYYYYHSYYGSTGATDSGTQTPAEWVPEPSFGRRLAGVLAKVMVGLLAFLVMLAIVAIALYFLSQYLGWGWSPDAYLQYLP